MGTATGSLELDPRRDRPAVDVSLVTHNSSSWLERLFSSLASGRYPASRLRLLIRDNASGDDTVEVLEQLADRFRGTFTDIVITTGDNLGFGRGHNDNVSRCKAPWVLVVNPDVELMPDALDHAVTWGVADDDQVAAWEFRQTPYEHPKDYHPVTLDTAWCSAACVLFRREALEKCDGFAPELFLYGEDVELSFRLRALGWTLRYLPRAVCRHDSYQEPDEAKPVQLLGSVRADFLVRARYGRLRDQWPAWMRAAHLVLGPRRFAGQRRAALAETLHAMRDRARFRRWQGRRLQPMTLGRFDYSPRRTGAFHPAPDLPDSVPTVSIVVRTLAGREGALVQALTTLAGQTWPDLEVVVVEDGSDSAVKLVEKFDAGHPGRWRHLPLDRRMGRSAAGNAGLAACSGEIIGFLDDDDLFYADHVETLAGALLQDPRADAAHARSWEIPTRIESYTPWRAVEHGRYLHGIDQLPDRLILESNPFPIQSVLFRRCLYERCGGFDESLDMLEDWNLWVRFSANGRFVTVPRLTSCFRTPAERAARKQRLRALDRAYPEVRRRNAQSLGLPVPPVPGIFSSLRQYLRRALAGLPAGEWLLNRAALRRWR